jgi:hypothetical protein
LTKSEKKVMKHALLAYYTACNTESKNKKIQEIEQENSRIARKLLIKLMD